MLYGHHLYRKISLRYWEGPRAHSRYFDLLLRYDPHACLGLVKMSTVDAWRLLNGYWKELGSTIFTKVLDGGETHVGACEISLGSRCLIISDSFHSLEAYEVKLKALPAYA